MSSFILTCCKGSISFLLLLFAYPCGATNSILPKHQEIQQDKPAVKDFSIFAVKRYTMPRIPIYDADEKPVMFKAFRGKVVVLYFWATWCPSCLIELQRLNQLQKDLDYRDISDIKIVAVSVDFKGRDFQQQIWRNNKVDALTYYHDYKQQLQKALAVDFLPRVFILNPEEQVVAEIPVTIDWQDQELWHYLLTLRNR